MLAKNETTVVGLQKLCIANAVNISNIYDCQILNDESYGVSHESCARLIDSIV